MQNSIDMFSCQSGIVLEYLLDGVPGDKVVDDRLERNPRPIEAGLAPENIRIDIHHMLETCGDLG